LVVKSSTPHISYVYPATELRPRRPTNCVPALIFSDAAAASFPPMENGTISGIIQSKEEDMRTKIITRGMAAAILAGIIIFTIGSVHASAQVPAEIGEAMKKLQGLAGEWEGKATIVMGGETINFTLHHSTTRIADGLGLQIVESASIPGLGAYSSVNLIGYDAGGDQYHIYSVTSDGYSHDHKGSWSSGNTLTFVYDGPDPDGKRFVETIPLTLRGPNEYHFESRITVDGADAGTFTATMKRKR
jgi:hypothetical protein